MEKDADFLRQGVELLSQLLMEAKADILAYKTFLNEPWHLAHGNQRRLLLAMKVPFLIGQNG
jgi:hypothetical protein